MLLRCLLASSLMAIVVTAAQAQTPTSSPRMTLAVVPATVRAGDDVSVYADVTVAADVAGQTTTVTLDPLAIGLNKFVVPMEASAYAPQSCPSGHQCYRKYALLTDVYVTPGPHTFTVTATDAKGRTTTGTVAVTVTAPQDSDRDGLPDVWESRAGLWMYPFQGTSAEDANGDPDGDGVTNLQEFRAHTSPVARYQRVFAEGSYGNAQSLTSCFDIAPWEGTSSTRTGPVHILAIGDGGRTAEQFLDYFGHQVVCPLGDEPPFVADRIVAVIVESYDQVAVERTTQTHVSAQNMTVTNTSLGAQGPSRTWYFARGSAGRGLDLFFLAFNPGTTPVEATWTFTGGPDDAPARITRSLPPGVRTTIWVEQDLPDAAAYDAAVTVTASDGIYVERAWRFQAPGRTVPHDSVSRGAAVASTTWYFAAGDLSDAFDTSFAVMNPSEATAAVEARFVRLDGVPIARAFNLPPHTRQILRPRDLGIGAASVGVTVTATNGVGIVAERTVDGQATSGSWRQSAIGAMTAGTNWTFANAAPVRSADQQTDLLILNTSTAPGRARLSDNAITTTSTTIDLPPQSVVRLPLLNFYGGFVSVASESTTGGTAPAIVVERVTYATIDGVSRARQVTIVGNVVR
jgi:hypothetical protein